MGHSQGGVEETTENPENRRSRYLYSILPQVICDVTSIRLGYHSSRKRKPASTYLFQYVSLSMPPLSLVVSQWISAIQQPSSAMIS